MSYTKSFSCTFIIYPDFYKDPYSEYIKEKINKWISECFITYNSYFKIKIVQHNLVYYEYDTEKDKRDINFKKLWSNPYGQYTIFISGAGIIHKGISNSINPPLNIVDNLIDKVTFKYQEVSDIDSPTIIAYGKGIGLPIKYSCSDYYSEYWNNGFCDEDVYCSNWKLSISCDDFNYDKTLSIINKLMKYNTNKNFDMDINPYEFTIEINTSFFLQNVNKLNYIKLLNELSCLAIEENGINIEECKMEFMAQNNDIYSLENYYFDELSGKFIVKNTIPL